MGNKPYIQKVPNTHIDTQYIGKKYRTNIKLYFISSLLGGNRLSKEPIENKNNDPKVGILCKEVPVGSEIYVSTVVYQDYTGLGKYDKTHIKANSTLYNNFTINDILQYLTETNWNFSR